MNTQQKIEMMIQRETCGIKGVKTFTKGEGLTFAISMCTHGNEQEGLAALDIIPELEKSNFQGQVIFILANPEAALNNVRFIDNDMNRLTCEPLKEWKTTVENQRAKELFRLVYKIDYILDIHSTPGPSEPMTIPLKNRNGYHNHIPWFYSPILVTGIDEHQKGRPFASFFNYAYKYGVEVGQQGTENAKKQALNIVREFLGLSKPKKESDAKYRIVSAIHLKDPTATFLPEFLAHKPEDMRLGLMKEFKAGQVIAHGKAGSIKAEHSGVLLFPRRQPKTATKTVCETEDAFIAEKIE